MYKEPWPAPMLGVLHATTDTFQEWHFCCQYDQTSSAKMQGSTVYVAANTALSVDTVATNKHFKFLNMMPDIPNVATGGSVKFSGLR